MLDVVGDGLVDLGLDRVRVDFEAVLGLRANKRGIYRSARRDPVLSAPSTTTGGERARARTRTRRLTSMYSLILRRETLSLRADRRADQSRLEEGSQPSSESARERDEDAPLARLDGVLDHLAVRHLGLLAHAGACRVVGGGASRDESERVRGRRERGERPRWRRLARARLAKVNSATRRRVDIAHRSLWRAQAALASSASCTAVRKHCGGGRRGAQASMTSSAPLVPLDSPLKQDQLARSERGSSGCSNREYKSEAL